MLVGCDKSSRESQEPTKVEGQAKSTNVVNSPAKTMEEKLEAQVQQLIIENVRAKEAEMSVRALEEAVEVYALMHHGKRPESLSNLVEGDRPVMQGGKGALFDPWNNPYMLKKLGKRYYVMSCGPDGVEGTEDDIRSDKH